MRRWLGLVVRLLSMVLLVGAFVHWVDWEQASTVLAGLAWPPLAAMALLYALGQVLNGLGWRYLARAGGIPLSFSAMLRHDLGSVFWSTVLPGSIAGEVVKGARISARGRLAESATVAILTARLVGGATSALLALSLSVVATVPQPALSALRLACLGVVVAGLGGVLLLRFAPGLLRRTAPRLLARIQAAPPVSLGGLAFCFATTLGAHLCFAGVHAAYFAAVRAPIGLADAAMITTASTVAQAMPVTVAGLGVRELTVAGLGGLLVDPDHAAAASLLSTLAFAVPVALGGVLELIAPPTGRS